MEKNKYSKKVNLTMSGQPKLSSFSAIKMQKIAVAIVSLFMLVFFYKISSLPPELSDVSSHLDFAKILFDSNYVQLSSGVNSTYAGYMLYHLLTKLLSILLFNNYELASAIVLTSANLLTYFILLRIAKEMNIKNKFMILEIFSLLFIVCLPLTGKLYLPQGSPSIWHNPTYIVSKPFSLLAFYQFYRVDGCGKQQKKDYALLSLYLFLSCFGKPSFSIILLPAMAIHMLYKRFKARKFDFLGILKMFICVLPTLLLLSVQYLSVFTNEISDSTTKVVVGFKFGTFLNLDIRMSIIALLSTFILPVLYFVLFHDSIKNKKIVNFSVLCSLIGCAQYYFLYQAGRASGDFGWGYFMSIFVLYAVIVIDCMQQNNSKKKTTVQLVYRTQMILGYIYFIQYFLTQSYLH